MKWSGILLLSRQPHHYWRVRIFSFLLPVSPCYPPYTHWPSKGRAADVQVLVGFDKTNSSTQRTTVSDNLKPVGMSSTPFRSGPTRILNCVSDSSAVYLMLQEDNWETDDLPSSKEAELRVAVFQMSNKRYGGFCFNNASNRHVNNSVCAL